MNGYTRVIIQLRIGWEGHLKRIGRKRDAFKMLLEEISGRDN
jgi:hypothetical protein